MPRVSRCADCNCSSESDVKDPTFTAVLQSEFRVSDIVRRSSQDKLFELIVAIDDMVGEWSFTLRLCKHYEAHRKKHNAEVAEDAAKVDRGTP